MIYHNSKPVARRPRHTAPARRFEWRLFVDESHAAVALIKERYKFEKKETRNDQFFLLPGRKNQISKLNNNKTFEMKTLIDDSGPLELWETTAKSTIPMRRTLATMIGVRIPKFSGPCVAAMSPEELTETLSKKSRFYEVENERELFSYEGITAKISLVHVNDNENMSDSVSIAFECAEAEPLLEELSRLGLTSHDNVNFGQYLTAK